MLKDQEDVPKVIVTDRFPEMGHFIGNEYNRVCIDLTRYGFSGTFIPLPSSPP